MIDQLFSLTRLIKQYKIKQKLHILRLYSPEQRWVSGCKGLDCAVGCGRCVVEPLRDEPPVADRAPEE